MVGGNAWAGEKHAIPLILVTWQRSGGRTHIPFHSIRHVATPRRGGVRKHHDFIRHVAAPRVPNDNTIPLYSPRGNAREAKKTIPFYSSRGNAAGPEKIILCRSARHLPTPGGAKK